MLICVTGPECSGKTTLTQSLAQALSAVSVAEYAREYMSAADGHYTFEDLDTIAERQVDLVCDAEDTYPDREEGLEEGVVITDTFLLVIVIWSLHKYGKVSDKIKELDTENQPDFYILCRPDLPWEQDPLRESPHEREALFERYLEHIKSSDIPYVIAEGLGPKRAHTALKRIESLIQNKLP